ncbi:MAG: hypothetical protein KME15_08545 [Drouetiella hepatica Uher 2000/2452]|jgi:hypothetical protein|uniref:Uncharacterized protein n=1 Tax=Drouetiella hepatica Uher 2000/2452 TaxID=904376 RepID=A0A951Q9Y2_9CYAN|nr:hypothetical protein [Drouetiella hepatica Uher 2000/2452]
MNALPRYNYPQPPDPTRRKMVRRRPRRNPHQAVILENGFKLGVNCLLSVIALSALVKLVPYNLAQQAKLKEIRVEVSEVEGRVDRLQADLNRQFDPQQAMSVMQEESIRVDPRQRQIVWITPTDSLAQTAQEANATYGRSAQTNPAFYPPAVLPAVP